MFNSIEVGDVFLFNVPEWEKPFYMKVHSYLPSKERIYFYYAEKSAKSTDIIKDIEWSINPVPYTKEVLVKWYGMKNITVIHRNIKAFPEDLFKV